jgi:hypothetical protein
MARLGISVGLHCAGGNLPEDACSGSGSDFGPNATKEDGARSKHWHNHRLNRH